VNSCVFMKAGVTGRCSSLVLALPRFSVSRCMGSC